MKSIVSVVLSISLIFSSVAPSYAQAQGAVKVFTKATRYSGTLSTKNHTKALQIAGNRQFTASTRAFYAELAGAGEYSSVVSAKELRQKLQQKVYSARIKAESGLEDPTAAKMDDYLVGKIRNTVNSFKEIPVADINTLISAQNPAFIKSLEALERGAAYAQMGAQPEVLTNFYKQAKGSVLEEVALTIAARGLLRMKAYVQLRALYGKTSSFGVWKGIQRYATESNIPLVLGVPQGEVVVNEGLREFLGKRGNGAVLHTDASYEATKIWMEGFKPEGVPARSAQGKAPEAVAETPEVSKANTEPVGIPVVDVTATAPLTVAPLNTFPSSVAEGVSGESAVASAEVSAQPAKKGIFAKAKAFFSPKSKVEAAPVAEGTSSTSGTLYSGFPFQSFGAAFKKFFARSPKELANREARQVLSKRYPLPTQLRDILLSEASVSLKQDALISLYQQGHLTSAIRSLPKETQRTIQEYSNSNDIKSLKTVLYNLYSTQVFDATIRSVSNAVQQTRFSQQLQDLLAQESFAERARTAYEDAVSLPLQGENFTGVVPSVPEANLKNIESTFRWQEGFAESNKAAPTTKKGMVYYKNNVPFYYRNSKGELSSKPVGILTQIPANWYGRMLSKVGFASKPGFSIPEGFVLALDEQGQWKLVMPNGNLAVVNANKKSAELLKEIQINGSKRIAVDTPYSTTDLLAMANMLENNANLNLELTLNTPHSLKQFLAMHALFIGNDAGMVLAGPFKSAVKDIGSYAKTLANLVSGIGYATPILGGKMMNLMTKWGNVKTTQIIYGMTSAALAYSLFKIGMNGFVDPSTISLGELAIPTIALVAGASLANTFVQTFLNFFKDPASRTAAHLDFSKNKQYSRLGLTALTAAAAMVGMNWTIVVPVGLTLVAASEMLFLNTPVFLQGIHRTPEQIAKENAEIARAAKEMPAHEATYKKFINSLPEVKDIATRVKMVYASYAASLLVLGQGATEVLGKTGGQILVATFMLGTALTRQFASKQVANNKMTDDQLTGISLPLLATTGAALALLPYSGPLALATGITGLLHHMATAVPGQLDSARLQNIVSAQMQKRKQEVLDNPALTKAEKDTKIAELTREEKNWASLAAKNYSYYNAHGLIGIGTAAAAALLFADLGPQWTQDLLSYVSGFLGQSGESASLALSRLIFGYSATMAGVLAWKNRALTRDFLGVFKKEKITTEAIGQGTVTPSTFGFNNKNLDMRLAEVNKTLKDLEGKIVDYGVSSEQKMTKILQQMVTAHNRLVAAKALNPSSGVVSAGFVRLKQIAQSYYTVLYKNNLSVMLNREFTDNFCKGLGLKAEEGRVTDLNVEPTYIEEGVYSMSKEYAKYEQGNLLIKEIDQLAGVIKAGDNVTSETYSLFISYQNEAKKILQEYAEANVADSSRVLALMEKLNGICISLKELDMRHGLLENNKGPTSSKDVQRLRDMLSGYSAN